MCFLQWCPFQYINMNPIVDARNLNIIPYTFLSLLTPILPANQSIKSYWCSLLYICIKVCMCKFICFCTLLLLTAYSILPLFLDGFCNSLLTVYYPLNTEAIWMFQRHNSDPIIPRFNQAVTFYYTQKILKKILNKGC